MKRMNKVRGDAGLFVPGVDRRGFVRQVTTCAAAAVALNALPAKTRAVAPHKNGPIMLDELTHSLFAPRIGAKFDARISSTASVTLELIEVALLPPQPNRPASLPQRAPFSLVFRAPRGTQAPQQIFELRHPDLGAFAIFMVPIGPDETGPRYEAVFN